MILRKIFLALLLAAGLPGAASAQTAAPLQRGLDPDTYASLARDAAFVARLREALAGVGEALKVDPALLPARYTGFISKDNRFYASIRDAGLATGKLVPKH